MYCTRLGLVVVLIGVAATPARATEDRRPTTYRMYASFKARVFQPPAPLRPRNRVTASVESLDPLRIALQGSWLEPQSAATIPVTLRHDAALADRVRKYARDGGRSHGRWTVSGYKAATGAWVAQSGSDKDLLTVLRWIDEDDGALLRRLQSLVDEGLTRPSGSTLAEAVRFTIPNGAMGVKSRLLVTGLGVEWHREWLDANEAKRWAIVTYLLPANRRKSLSTPFRIGAESSYPGPTIENGRGWRCNLHGTLIGEDDAAPFFRAMNERNRALFAMQPVWCYEHVPQLYEAALRREAIEDWLRGAELLPEQLETKKEPLFLEVRWLPKGIERSQAERAARDGFARVEKRFQQEKQRQVNKGAHSKFHASPYLAPVLKHRSSNGWDCRIYGIFERGNFVALHEDGFLLRGGWGRKGGGKLARERLASLMGKQPPAGEPFWGE